MNKLELIEHIAAEAEITKAAATRALDAFTTAVSNSLKKDEKVTLVGFGTFKKSHRKARQGRDPRTGAVIQIAASVVPKFTAGKEFKESIKE